MRSRSQAGFTLVEVLVAFALFSVLSISFYAVVFGAVRGSGTSRSVAKISQEARLGLNRMVRDTREAERIVDLDISGATASYTIRVDFNRDGDTSDSGETEEFVFSQSAREITLNGDVLVRGVRQIPGTDIFSFSSNLLEYDNGAAPGTVAGDGVATMAEVAAAEGGDVFPYLTNVTFALRVFEEGRSTDFRTEAQLRNRR